MVTHRWSSQVNMWTTKISFNVHWLQVIDISVTVVSTDAAVKLIPI